MAKSKENTTTATTATAPIYVQDIKEATEKKVLFLDSESNKCLLWIPSSKIEKDYISTSLKQVKYRLPKNIKTDEKNHFYELIQSMILDSVESKAEKEIAKLNDKELELDSMELSDSDKMKRDSAKKRAELAKTTRERLHLPDSVENKLANLISCYILGDVAYMDVTRINASIISVTSVLDNVLVKYMNKDSVKMTESEELTINACRTTIKEKLSEYVSETDFSDAFKVSISSKDVVSIYKMFYKGVNKKKFIQENKSDKAVAGYLQLLLLGKLKGVIEND